jgi:hypothetical protein
MPVTHNELARFKGFVGRSPQEKYLAGGHFQGIAQYVCDWSDRYSLISEVGQDGGELYPHNTSTSARAYAANIVGYGKCSQHASNSSLVAYPHALVTVFYSTRAPQVYQGKFVTEEIEGRFEYQPLDTSKLHWTGVTGPAYEDDFALPIPTMTYVCFITSLA